MSFGFGVGDILAIIGHANRLRKAFSNAPQQFNAISSELKNCSLILQEVDVYFEGYEISAAQKIDLRNVLESSKKVLDDVEKVLVKHTKLGAPDSSLRGRTKRTWQRLTWEPEEIRDLRSGLQSVVSQLNAFADGLNRKNVSKLLEQQTVQGEQMMTLVIRQESQMKETILDWLSPPDYAAQHNDHRNQRLPGTGLQLLGSDVYKNWKQAGEDAKILLLSGIPGAGKTVLASIIIDSLQEECNGQSDAALCYYYCDYNRLPSPNVESICLCLLRQLLQDMANLPDKVKDMFEVYKSRSVMPALKSIKDVLLDVVGSFKKVYIVMDALDELTTSTGLQKAFLGELVALSRVTNVRILATSRPLPDIRNALGPIYCIDIQASEEDVVKYVEANIHSLPSFVSRQVPLQDEIKHSVVTASDGMFLLATLCMRALIGTKSPRHVRKVMESFGKGATGYNKAYTDTMTRIAGQIQAQKELAIDALMWATYGERLLTAEELVHALATEPEESEFHEDNIPDIEDILSACCGLIILEQKSSLVRLVHRTAQEFFKGDGQSWLLGAQNRLSTVCNAYLTFVGRDPDRLLPGEAFRQTSARYPLYGYASMHWRQHASERETQITLQDLVDQQRAVDASSQAFLQHLVPKYLDLCHFTPGITGLHLIAYHGLVELLPSFLERYDIDSIDQFGITSITYAVRNNQIEVVKTLIEKGARVDLLDREGLRPLCLAVNKCHIQLVEILLNCKSEPLDIDEMARSPLHLAAKVDSTEIIRLLLDKGYDPCCTDESGRSPLIHSIMHGGGVDAVRLLIERGANPLQPDSDGRYPLSYAVDTIDGHDVLLACLDLFLGTGDPHGMAFQAISKDFSGWTPFMYAARRGDVKSLRLLADLGADCDDCNLSGTTPLMIAIEARNAQAALWLLEQGANPNCSNMHGLTALMMASIRNMAAVGDELISRGADVRAKDVCGRNALHLAASCNAPSSIACLIEAGIDLRARDATGRGVLEYACLGGCSPEIIAKGLEYHIGNFSTTIPNSKLSVLHLACQIADFQTLKLLMDAGFEATTTETDQPALSWTPLDIAFHFNNQKLIGGDAKLRTDLPWRTLIPSGIVKESQTAIEPFRHQSSGPVSPISGVVCDYCDINPVGSYYTCLHCTDAPPDIRWDLCIFCKPASEYIHAGHEWKYIDTAV